MKQKFAWALVDDRDRLLVFDHRVPVYWLRAQAMQRRAEWVSTAKDPERVRVAKVTILEVHKPR